MSEISTWAPAAADNDTAAPNGFPEGMAPSGVNDSGREVMAAVRRWYEDAQWTDWGHVPTRVDGDTFTVATDLTAVYQVGRRLKVDGSATGYCTIASSSYLAPNTTVNVTMDSGSLPATLSTIYVGVLSASNGSIPLHSALLLTGTIADARLSANVPLLDAANTFTEAQTIGLAGSYAAPQLLLADAAYGVGVDATGNVFFKNTNNGVFLFYDASDAIQINLSNGTFGFTGNINVTGALTEGGVAVLLATDELDADNITSGTVANARLPATINVATDLQINSVPIFASGTFTATLTGCTTSPTGTATWYRAGGMVTLVLPASLLGISNSTSCTITGLPAGIQPATLGIQKVRVAVFNDNGATLDNVNALINDGSGTITFLKSDFSGFTSSGTKGPGDGIAITYLLT